MTSATGDMLDLIEDGIYGVDEDGSERAMALHHGMRLHSTFQPIYSLSHGRVVGYEGLLRAVASSTGQALPPYQVFSSAQDEPEIVYLDRLSRALHMRNFCNQNDQSNWLFLNINPQVIVQGKHYGSFFKDLLERYQMPAARVVVEIIEGAIADEDQLTESVQFYKNLGCLVAIDDFGAGHSNFERIWRLAPDIVKLDRSMILQAVSKPTARRVLPGIVSLIHEAGSLVLIEGIETVEEAMIAMDTDVDLVQGNYFGSPGPLLQETGYSSQISELFRKYSDTIPLEIRHKRLALHNAAFAEAVARLQTGFSIAQACAPLLELAGGDRCYLLNRHGIQIGASLIAESHSGAEHARYQPLADGSGANWFRRPYLRRALQNPRELQVTRPYLSIATGNLCVTISMALNIQSQTQVLCYDVEWGDN
jgi:EAL domain-containing protein (putative c-di-GMP-specific phosphodiesterase class I)